MAELVLGADVGGTKTLLALAETQADGPRVVCTHRYANDDFADFYALLRRFIGDAPEAVHIVRACLGVAGPHEADTVQLTNRDWRINVAKVGQLFPAATVKLANDFEVAAYGVELLAPEDLLTLQQGEPVKGAPQVVFGAGTGLGVAYRIWDGSHYRVLPGEGGHVGFAPSDARQVEIWRAVHAAEGRVGCEMIVSGMGITRIYEFLSGARVEPADITQRALEQGDAVASEALEIFARCYGAAAGDHALAVLARGGVFLAGGIAPRLRTILRASGLLEAFNAKGHHRPLTQRMPLHVVLNERLGLLGATLMAARG